MPAPRSLDHLSPEIVLAILLEFTDFDSLYNVLVASPAAWRVFMRYPLLVTESILSSPDSLLPPQIQQLIRAVILIRASSMPFSSLSVFKDFLREKMPRQEGHAFGEVMAFDAESLAAASPSSAALWSVVSTARHISVLAHDCLDFYLARVRDPSFAPQHCHDPSLNYSLEGGNYDGSDPPWRRKFVGEPVMKVDIGPPSWVEEMRVVRSLWFLQLVGETQLSAPAHWQEHGFAMPEELSPLRFANENAAINRVNPQTEEIRTTMEYLTSFEMRQLLPTMDYRGTATRFRLPRPRNGVHDFDWITPLPALCLEEWPGDAFYKFTYPNKVIQHDIPPDMRDEIPRLSRDYFWDQTCTSLASLSNGLVHWMWVSCSSASPIAGVGFNSFRRLGFALWDTKRMYFLGLLPEPRPETPHDNVAKYFFAWESILPADKAERLKAKLDAKALRGL